MSAASFAAAPCVPSCQHAPLPPQLHSHNHPPSHFTRSTTLPCGVDPRLLGGFPPSSSPPSTCHTHANIPRSARADLTTSDAVAAVVTHSHPSLCLGHQHLHQAPQACCSYTPEQAAAVTAATLCHKPACCAESAAMQQHKQLQHHQLHLQQQAQMQEAAMVRAANFNGGSYAQAVAGADGAGWSVAQQLRMPSGR